MSIFVNNTAVHCCHNKGTNLLTCTAAKFGQLRHNLINFKLLLQVNFEDEHGLVFYCLHRSNFSLLMNEKHTLNYISPNL